MLENQEKIVSLLKDVIKLVEAKNKAHQKSGISTSEDFTNSYEEYANSPTRKALYDYFNNLSYEDIQLIQAIMYIGRDGKDYYFDEKVQVTAQELLNEALSRHKGLHCGNKDVAISHVVGKAPLDKYLILGAELLNIPVN